MARLAAGTAVEPIELVALDSTLVAVHYGSHADDQWSVDEVLALR